ncbi:MAG TPA: hypothetical protein VG273_12745 [Bryobacteraceae bacterium]|jgi:hypothetical protein|nr:hypothetical protein [Bryobacteraceae bacterium]
MLACVIAPERIDNRGEPIEPYEKLGGLHPLYILQFDREGALTSPQTAARLLDELAAGAFTHLYLFSHGWNNSFGDATKLYRRFFLLYLELRSKHDPHDENARPVFVGLHWPSIILNFPWEKGPRFAAAPQDEDQDEDDETDTFLRARDSIAELLNPDHRPRFYALTEAHSLSQNEAAELADILLPVYRANALDSDSPEPAPVAADSLIAAWNSLSGDPPQPSPDYSKHGRIPQNAPPCEPRAAAATDFLDPRNALRVTTVLTMKDRAGVVGRNGLAPLLPRLTGSGIPVRLIGHSFGARVCLTALSAPWLHCRIDSLLLLQPAVNQYCFAASIPGLGFMTKGGFVAALKRIAQPVYTTFSRKDVPLHSLFHLAARRPEDRGEIRFAAEGPSEFSALGGYGPAGLPASEFKEEKIHSAGLRYSVPAGVRILALNGSAGEISGHGDVVSDYTCWALIDQEKSGQEKRGQKQVPAAGATGHS